MNWIVIAAALTAACGIGVNSAMAQDVRSANTEAKVVYNDARQDCSLLRGQEQAQCLSDARGNYLSTEMRCESFMSAAKDACLKQAEAAEARRLVAGSSASSVRQAVDRD